MKATLSPKQIIVTLTPAETFTLIQTLAAARRELATDPEVEALEIALRQAYGEPIAETDGADGGAAVAA